MRKERCDNCLYEYTCDWRKAGKDLRCEEWKPESDEWELENDDFDPMKVMMRQCAERWDKQILDAFARHGYSRLWIIMNSDRVSCCNHGNIKIFGVDGKDLFSITEKSELRGGKEPYEYGLHWTIEIEDLTEKEQGDGSRTEEH